MWSEFLHLYRLQHQPDRWYLQDYFKSSFGFYCALGSNKVENKFVQNRILSENNEIFETRKFLLDVSDLTFLLFVQWRFENLLWLHLCYIHVKAETHIYRLKNTDRCVVYCRRVWAFFTIISTLNFLQLTFESLKHESRCFFEALQLLNCLLIFSSKYESVDQDVMSSRKG